MVFKHDFLCIIISKMSDKIIKTTEDTCRFRKLSETELARFRQFMANPDDEKLRKSLGISQSDRVETHLGSQRFSPPSNRIDDVEFFETLAKSYELLVSLIDSFRINEGNVQDSKTGYSSLLLSFIESVYRPFMLSLGVLNPSLELMLRSIESGKMRVQTYMSDIKYITILNGGLENGANTSNILKTVSQIRPTLIELPQINEYVIDKIILVFADWLEMLAEEILKIKDFFRADNIQAAYLTSISLLYSMLKNYPNMGGRSTQYIGCIFNALLELIGLRPIPIYAIDFAPFVLNLTDFTAYVSFIISDVENQHLPFSLPEGLLHNS